MSSVALIIIYNHPHEENIPVLEKIYRNRFTDIYHLVPAYRGTQSNVIPVYERFDLFQHYLPQALPEFFHEKYEHYLFIADDLIINPRMNENNYAEYLHLDRDTCFITSMTNLYDIQGEWRHTQNGIDFERKHSLFNLEHELPEPKKALACLNCWRYAPLPLYRNSCLYQAYLYFRTGGSSRFQIQNVQRKFLMRDSDSDPYWKQLKNKVRFSKTDMDYPLIQSFPDIFCVNASSIKPFCHFCGVFSCADLFVAMAIPTALALCTSKIITSDDLDMECVCFWEQNIPYKSPSFLLDNKLADEYKQDLQILFDNFPEKLLFVHPIKISESCTDRLMQSSE